MKTIILSLGGSAVVPDKVDTEFLKEFKKLILSYIKNYRFAIYVGGGSLARIYQAALKQTAAADNTALDWIGIEATRMNANLVKSMFGKDAEDFIIVDPTKKYVLKKKLVIAQGWKPGWSTDYDAVLLAKNIGAREVINITNVEQVCDKDPRKFNEAKPIETIAWCEFRKLVGDKWDPGLNAPFDPIASKEAEKSNIKVAIMGKDLSNLKNYLDGKKFKGTVIN